MSCTCLSNKNSSAPVFYSLLQASLLSGFCVSCPSILDIQSNHVVALFWLDVIITLITFFISHLKDPGYVPYDTTVDTENEESHNAKRLPRIKRRQESQMRLKAESRIENDQSQDAYGINIELAAKLDYGTKNNLRSQRNTDSITLPNVAKLSTAAGTQTIEKDATHTIPIKMDENNNVDYDHYQGSPESQRQRDSPEKFQHSPLHPNSDNRDENDAPECENTVVEESILEIGNKFDNIQMRDDETENDISLKDTSAKSSDKIPSLNAIQLEIKSAQGDGSQNRIDSPKKEKVVPAIPKIKEATYETTLNTSLNIVGPSVDDDQKKFLKKNAMKSESYQVLNEEELSTARNDRLIMPSAFKIGKLNSSFNGGKTMETALDIPSERDQNAISANRNLIKNQFNLSQSTSIKKEDEQPEEYHKDKEEPELLYVERRYCTACNLEQPLRAKHCKDCNRCVGQYDHHCPWIGNCVGEKNHQIFFWFLLFQSIQVAWAIVELLIVLFNSNAKDWFSENVWKLGLTLVIAFFNMMVISLFFYHGYLAMANLTTWENLSWEKISYLKDWPEDWGSPFSEGLFKNLKFFFCTPKKVLKRWKMPKYKTPPTHIII